MTNIDSEFAPLVYATAEATALKAIQEEFGAQALVMLLSSSSASWLSNCSNTV